MSKHNTTMITVRIVSLLAILILTLSGQAAPMGTAFTFQGHLEDAGAPADGAYDLQFKLHDDPVLSSPVGVGVLKEDVLVSGGLFTVQIDPAAGDASLYDGRALWLELCVRHGTSLGSFTVLTPRQKITPVVYALHTRGLHVDNNGRLGINQIAPTAQLDLGGIPGVDGIRFPDGTLQTTSVSGDITGVTAGKGLTGGGSSGNVTLHAEGGVGINVTPDHIVLDTSYTDARYVNENQANSIDSSMIVNGEVRLADLSINSVDSSKIVNNSITDSDLATDSVGSLELDDNSVASANIINGSIMNADISPSAAIAVSKILGNAGIDYRDWTTFYSILDGETTIENMGSVTVTAPTAGYVVVWLTGDTVFFRDGKTINIGINTDTSSLDSPTTRVGRLDGSGTDRFSAPFTVLRVFPVSAGVNRFYALAQGNSVFGSGQVNVSPNTMVAAFFATRY